MTQECRNGHPDFIRLTEEEMDLHERKNSDYSSGGDPLGNFHRVSKILEMYPGLSLSDPTVVALVFMMKQMDAVFWSLSRHEEGKIEGNAKRMKDVSVYMKLATILNEEKHNG